MKIRIVNQSVNPLPQYATPLSAGMDLYANNTEPISLGVGERTLIPTGIFIELPAGFEAQIRPRSGLAYKNGISIPNAPGTIDADYRGEVKVLLINLGQEPFPIHCGDRIAQLIIARHETIQWQPVPSLTETERGEGGFGHTGV